MMIFWLFLCLYESSHAVIYKLNASEYALMPPVIELDAHEACLRDEESVYCFVETALVSDTPSPLMHMIQEYSVLVNIHYNHSLLRRGVCVTQSCKQFYEGPEADLRATLEICLNESLYNKYKLKNVLSEDDIYCNNKSKYLVDHNVNSELSIVLTYVLTAIVLLNIIGSLCECFYEGKNKNCALRFVLNFSLRRNWRKLIAQDLDNSHKPNLLPIHGLRAMTMICVLMCHGSLITYFTSKATAFIEDVQKEKANFILMGGVLIIQTFFVISSFLLVHTLLAMNEKQEIKWKDMPKLIFFRWIRLTPSYALTLAFMMVYLPRLCYGPLMYKLVDRAFVDCRNYWWTHMLYVNNYNNDSYCFGHTWYLAADFHLYTLTIIAWLACRTPRVRSVIFPAICVAAVIIPGLYAYFYDLDGYTMAHPELIMKRCVRDPSYTLLYTKTHTNMTAYVVGAILAHIVHHLQKKEVNINKYKSLKHRIMFWALFPMALCMCYLGGVYYTTYPKPSLIIRALMASLAKPLFSIVVAGLCLGTFFNIETLYRNVLEWRWFVPLSRLSYTAYLVHECFLMLYLGNIPQLIETSHSVIHLAVAYVIVTSFSTGLVLWLMFEAPIQGVVKEILRGQGHKNTVEARGEGVQKIKKTKELKKKTSKIEETQKRYKIETKPKNKGII